MFRTGEGHRQVDGAQARPGIAGGLAAAAPAGLGPGGDEVEEVPDVDHPARVVERLAIDRQARMPGGAEQRQQVAERRIRRDRDDVGARHHDVGDAALAQAQHVREHRPLLRGQVGDSAAVLRQRLGDVFADRTAMAQAEPVEELAEPVREAAAARVRRWGRSGVVAHDAGCGFGVRVAAGGGWTGSGSDPA